MSISTVYSENGYKDRNEYLIDLAKEYDIKFDSLLFLADCLGEEQDFDMLIKVIEDYCYYYVY